MDNHFDLSLCDVPTKTQQKAICVLSPEMLCADSASQQDPRGILLLPQYRKRKAACKSVS